MPCFSVLQWLRGGCSRFQDVLGSSCHLAAGAVESSLEVKQGSIPQCTNHHCQLCPTKTNEALRKSRADILNVSLSCQTCYFELNVWSSRDSDILQLKREREGLSYLRFSDHEMHLKNVIACLLLCSSSVYLYSVRGVQNIVAVFFFNWCTCKF